MNTVKKSVTVLVPRADVYAFWRDFENLPRFMTHLKSVTALRGSRSHWVMNGPGGNVVEWDADLVADRPGELVSWRTVSDGEGIASHSGSVRFLDAPGDRGTEVHVELHYDAPAARAPCHCEAVRRGAGPADHATTCAASSR